MIQPLYCQLELLPVSLFILLELDAANCPSWSSHSLKHHSSISQLPFKKLKGTHFFLLSCSIIPWEGNHVRSEETQMRTRIKDILKNELANWSNLRRLLHNLCRVFSLDGLHVSPHNVWTCPPDHGRCPGRPPPGPGLVLQWAPMVHQWRWWMFYRYLTGLKSGGQADKSTASVTSTFRNCWLILVYH